jgi:lysophospholipase L1-like esterase
MGWGQHALGARAAAALLAVLFLAGCAAGPSRPAGEQKHWVSSWGTALMVPDKNNLLADELYVDASFRQVVRVSLPGSRIRVRVSNVHGTAPFTFEAASIARAVKPGQANVVASSLVPLLFNGKTRVTVPAGAEFYSDPVAFEHAAGTDFAISLHFREAPARQTGHPGSRTTSFIAKGNRVNEAAWTEATKVVRWYQLADIEVEVPRTVGVVVAIGDSITDGNGSTTDGNDRWTDALVARLAREGGPVMGVVNAGIGGNRLLRDGLGPNVLSRFDRDVISRSGVTHAIVLIGVNDLGSQHRNREDTPEARAQLLEDLQAGYRQLAQRARAHGICILGGTILAYTGSDYYKPAAANEAVRQQLNAWIRTSGTFDDVVDFDAATRDPAQPERMRKEHDIGDGLHPSPAGFRAMAEAVPLASLRACPSR